MRMRREQSVVLSERVGTVARPGVRARMRRESRPHRVLFQTVCGLLLSYSHAWGDQAAGARRLTDSLIADHKPHRVIAKHTPRAHRRHSLFYESYGVWLRRGPVRLTRQGEWNRSIGLCHRRTEPNLRHRTHY